jgi:uncharacterized circularly permuted ATP-grasp superfamily protein/uncharacterized alpha-E superfamily protein
VLSWLKNYGADTQSHDELLDGQGGIRAHWRPLIEKLTSENPNLAQRALHMTSRMVVENGVTYNVYADTQGRDRPWMLDPVPVVLPADQWRGIEAGVRQRARLLNSMLADLYGRQQLLTEGIVPAELAFGHPNFLWPCMGTRPVGGHWLHFYAVDLARAPDGRWWVLADRTQTPSGAGYALENRQIIKRVFPDLMKKMGVASIGEFFAALRESMLSCAEEGEMPLAVILTPGPFNETYFEHAYLARRLGLTLVEGSDLTVRSDSVYMKTMGGLRRVHAILRRLDDDFCDPVELRADSALGVPGLLNVVRAGRVVVANALGSGVLESAAWLGFLPKAAEWLLNEELQLPSVATWWCGEQSALETALAQLDNLVIKPTFPNQSFEPVFARDLDAKSRKELIERMRLRPNAYVAQERMPFSRTPVLNEAGPPLLTARALAIRVYAMATPNGYQVMSGGLARIAADPQTNVVSTQRGGGSKDIWVVDAKPVATPFPTNVSALTRLRVRSDEVPSRQVENLYWLGRYTERCESKVRLLRATQAINDADQSTWNAALQVCLRAGLIDRTNDFERQIFSLDNPLGLLADLQRLNWSAAQVRGRLSAENWLAVREVQRFQMASADFFGDGARDDAAPWLDRLLLSLAALAGFVLDDMAQDDGWRMLLVGRRIERVLFMTELLAQRLMDNGMPTQAELEWLLDIGGSTIAYRTRYVAAPRLSSVMHLLLRDRVNPRALTFQCDALQRLLTELAPSFETECADALLAARVATDEFDLGTVEGPGYSANAARQLLAGSLRALGGAAGRLSDRLSLRFFSHVERDLQTVAS